VLQFVLPMEELLDPYYLAHVPLFRLLIECNYSTIVQTIGHRFYGYDIDYQTLASPVKKYIVHIDCLRDVLDAGKRHTYEHKRHNYKRQ